MQFYRPCDGTRHDDDEYDDSSSGILVLESRRYGRIFDLGVRLGRECNADLTHPYRISSA